MDKIKFKRNEDGLFDHVEYKFDDTGYIDWKAMIPKEFLVPNKDRIKDENVKVEDLEEKDLIILLGGIKYLAKLRGYLNLATYVKYASDNKIVCECHIKWRSNFETEGEEVSFTGIGEASINNTKGFGQIFLGPIAENRAFIRCVRNFLNINIVGNDELVEGYALDNASTSKVSKMAPSISPMGLLEKALKEKNSNFTALKKALLDLGGKEAEEAVEWESIKDIPERMVMALVSRIKGTHKPSSKTSKTSDKEAAPPKKRGRPKKVT